MTQIQIAHVDGAFRVYITETGINRRYLGPHWASPRQAMAYCDLQAAAVSPLRPVTSWADDPTLPADGELRSGDAVHRPSGSPVGLPFRTDRG